MTSFKLGPVYTCYGHGEARHPVTKTYGGRCPVCGAISLQGEITTNEPIIATIGQYADQGCYVWMTADGEELAKAIEETGTKVTRVAVPEPKRRRKT